MAPMAIDTSRTIVRFCVYCTNTEAKLPVIKKYIRQYTSPLNTNVPIIHTKALRAIAILGLISIDVSIAKTLSGTKA